jgi:glycosyl hydrolase family 114
VRLPFRTGRPRRAVVAAALAIVLASATAACDADQDAGDNAEPTRTAPAVVPSAPDARPPAPTAPGAPTPTASTPTTGSPTTAPSAPPAGSAAPPSAAPPSGAPKHVVPPAANAVFDYQIGGPYPPAANVRVLLRDRAADPEPGRYNVCYVNAFQAQPDAQPWWEATHPDLLLRKDGEVVMDDEWGEALLDISTDAKRARLADVVGGWIDECGRRGFQAVEPDNLDSFSRSQGRLTMADNVAFARLLADRAHGAGLAVGQKNTVEMLGSRTAVGFDFAIAEECARYDECGAYAAAFADRVLEIEYTRPDFDKACRAFGARLSIVLRDRDVTPVGDKAHVFDSC